MAPTPRAEAIAEPLRNALSEMQLALEPLTFDPQASDRSFTLGLNNFASVVIAPPLVASACGEAPGINLDMRPSGNLDVADCLDRGDIELAIGGLESPGERFLSQLLLEDPFVLVMRRGHPASRTALSAEKLASLNYMEISSSGEDTAFLDRWLAARGLARQVSVRGPYLSTRTILAQSDLVAVFSRRVAEVFVRNFPLEMREPAFESPMVRTIMLCHRRLEGHPAHRWLRDHVASVSRDLAKIHGEHVVVA
jgi:DNA-binding transcriptional LysR family regulator